MNLSDTFSLSWRTVRSTKLRTGITVAIIAFGIMALVGIITAIKAMNQKLTESFSTMGATGFSIRFKERNIRFGGGGSESTLSKKGARKEKKSNLGKPITDEEAAAFASRYKFPATVGLSVLATRNAIINFNSRKTSPNVFVFGADDNYLALNGFNLIGGRNFSRQDIRSGGNFCLLGYDVAKKLFQNRPERGVNAVVRINSIPYRVIGVLSSRGSSFGFSRDNVVVAPYRNIQRNFSITSSYVIGVMATDHSTVEDAMGEAEGLFRAVRKLNTTEASNFAMDRADAVAEKMMNSLGFLTISATVIGLITLVGAAIGLMNIMLVSVTERTKEVGLVKAIGGKSKMVRMQFLFEAIIISILGAFFGIVLGVGVGNLFSAVLSTGFVVPWDWIGYGIIICTLVGLGAGLYPAWKAGKLNPIEALRYE
ncbi:MULTISPECIES: ABC transporter permease [Chitinophagaceae]|uniref:ABC transporter permease n=1 Tax=Chitinophagaceae TaxID=563835 RepID=UPI000DF01E86|nr:MULTISPECIES: ABC transporter permease [Chitinophagaceae]RPD46606.1 ABC transporter permease [Paracnuella aquatica]